MKIDRETCSPTPPSQVLLLIGLLVLLFSPSASASPAGDSKLKDNKESKLSLNAVERGIGITGFNSHWEAISAWAKLAWMNLRSPDSFRSGTGEKMKAASKKSFETSKDTLEKTAAAAARAAGKAVGMTKEKIKKAVSHSDRNQDAEL